MNEYIVVAAVIGDKDKYWSNKHEWTTISKATRFDHRILSHALPPGSTKVLCVTPDNIIINTFPVKIDTNKVDETC